MKEIARLKIQLDDVNPRVIRRIEVPLAIRLADLHLVIQIAMGWENSHLYEFRIGRSLAWGASDPSWPGPRTLSAITASLADLLPHLKGAKKFQYVYDFGDDWLHTVKLEAIAAADPNASYPCLLEAHGACPPEDCGGPWGYGNYLEAIADPNHKDHDDMIEWRGPGFDPAAVDDAAIRKQLSELAGARKRKTKARP